MQVDALKRAGVRSIFQDSSSGVGKRPRLRDAIAACGRGDILVVWKIDRVARSLRDLLSILGHLQESGAAIKSLTEPIDTSSPIGEFTFQILGAVAQLERSMIRERVMAGQAAARLRGQTWGPKRVLNDAEALQVARMWRSGWFEQLLLADMFGLSESSLRDAIHRVEKRGRWKPLASEQ